MADQNHHLTVRRVASQLHLSQHALAPYGGLNKPASTQKHFIYGNYTNAGFSYPVTQSLVAANASPVFFQVPAEKGLTGFAIDFLIGGVSAAVSEIAAASIERVKLLIQNQDEMLKTGRLSEPYKGIGECFKRTIRDEGVMSLWHLTLRLRIPSRVCSTLRKTAILTRKCSVVTSHYARTRLANDAKAAKKGGERQFNGFIDIYKKTYASDGIAGLYRGFPLSAAGIFVYRGLYFGMYDSQTNSPHRIIAG
ncbi:putative mitochondrial carrier protein [Helianthus annuus]|nr:putative mitochondrial carrier protein [Helianthus annuus]